MKEIEEIKVGEYIRTRGIIGKLVRIEYDKIDTSLKWYVLDKGNYEITYVNKPYIEKHSKNIIDLIEVGDYVNGRLVLQVDYKNKNVCLLIPLTDTLANTNIMWYGYEDIKTVVTHEQMSNIEYRLED